MPELPDLILNRDYFNHHFLQKEIAQIKITAPQLLVDAPEKKLNQVLKGEQFKKAVQYGKYLFLPSTGKTGVSLHFGMTGEIVYLKKEDEKLPSYTCAVITFGSGERLAYADRRRLGRMGLAKDLDALIKSHDLGPDALQVGFEEFCERLAKKKGKLKPVLMDQSVIAGLGNVYTDEVLFQAKIHPESASGKLGENQLKLIHKNIAPVLKEAVKLHGERNTFSKSKYLMAHREEGEKCPRDKTVLTVKAIGGRTSYFCERCQVLYK
jgi:formamidopyrimidine-DNA glycosylase